MSDDGPLTVILRHRGPDRQYLSMAQATAPMTDRDVDRAPTVERS